MPVNLTTFTSPYPLKTAVLFLIFNRLDTTKEVFEAIRQAKPPRLYIAADGARISRVDEHAAVQEVREYVVNHIDWKCEVKTLFRDKNLGCKYAISGAITWFFENEEMGIILEDDCLPSQSFFWFCEELLEKYKNDMRVWHIAGFSTLNEDMLLNEDSYYFSKFNHIWGWAGWSNRWAMYDVNISKLDTFVKQNCIANITDKKLLKKFWLSNFRSVFNKTIDTWDYQWYFTTWINAAVSIIPAKNLVSNLGFGIGATHTSDEDNKLSKTKKYEIDLNLVHPEIMMPNKIYDEYNAKYLFGLSYFKYYLSKMKANVKKLVNGKKS